MDVIPLQKFIFCQNEVKDVVNLFGPFNFNTLATRTFQLATDEQLARSAVPALLIILVGLVPVIVLNKLGATAANRGFCSISISVSR